MKISDEEITHLASRLKQIVDKMPALLRATTIQRGHNPIKLNSDQTEVMSHILKQMTEITDHIKTMVDSLKELKNDELSAVFAGASDVASNAMIEAAVIAIYICSPARYSRDN